MVPFPPAVRQGVSDVRADVLRRGPVTSAEAKMKSVRFEKASEEIGVPREKISERYRSTAHGQTDRHDLFRFRASVYPW